MRWLLALALLVSFSADAAPAYYAFVAGAFIQGPDSSDVQVPNVVGETQSAADTDLVAAGLATGTVTQRCSSQAVNIVLTQSPVAGTFVALSSSVDLQTSNGVECPQIRKQKMPLTFGFGFGK